MASPGLEQVERAGASSPRLVARSLSGYLCGTHSGALARRRGDRLSPEQLGPVHRAQARPDPIDELMWAARWEPHAEVAGLAGRLRAALEHPAVVDLLIYGSHAGGTPTGFSDLDAVLVIEDEAAEDAAELRRLRPRVLDAQRALLAHQPMQHHGFEVATPKLLASADATLDLPRESLLSARPLFGRVLAGGFAGNRLTSASRLESMTAQLSRLDAWPRHPWKLHGAVSMFELLPALHLQATGLAISKSQSFAIARERFERQWWPYDVVNEVRAIWPRRPNRGLQFAAAAARNPWVAVAAWSRLPSGWPPAVRSLLSASCLAGLQELARLMADGAR